MPRKRKVCTVPGCLRAAHARELCNKHYLQRRKSVYGYDYSAQGVSRKERLAVLLSRCDGFLHTVVALNDRVNAQTRAVRSPEAQRLYELANELRAQIARELPEISEKSFCASDWLPSSRTSECGHHVLAKLQRGGD